jgi:hypothetical protein
MPAYHTNLYWQPLSETQLIQQILEVLRVEIRNSVEYVTACENAKDDYILFGDKLSDERVEINALLMMMLNYKRLKKECKINTLM